MKLTRHDPPPPQPPPTYTLELTEAQLLRLGRLSFTHERTDGHGGGTFYSRLPPDVMDKVHQEGLSWGLSPWVEGK